MTESITCTYDLETQETVLRYFHEAKQEWIEEKIDMGIVYFIQLEHSSPERSAEEIVEAAKEKRKEDLAKTAGLQERIMQTLQKLWEGTI